MQNETKMVNGKAFRNGGDKELVCEAMGQACLSVKAKVPIPIRAYIGCPKPTSIRSILVYLRPEAFDGGIIKEHLKRLLSGVMRRAVSAVPSPSIVTQEVLPSYLK